MPKRPNSTLQNGDDRVYRALASPVRRQILDIVREQEGITSGEIADAFAVSRFAVRKHLQSLLDAGLLSVVQEGTSKRHYLNPVPLQLLYDHWLSRFACTANGDHKSQPGHTN